MRLKTVTTALLLTSFLLLLGLPWLLGSRPERTAPRPVRRAYVGRLLAYEILMVATFAGSAVGAVLIVRRAREEYREAAMRNMQNLIEGASEDQARKTHG